MGFVYGDPVAQSALDGRKFARKSFDVACVQCEHSHSRQQVLFAYVAPVCLV